MGHVFGERLARMMIVLVTYLDGAFESLRFEGPTDWDVRDGHLVAWNEAGDMVAERDNVIAATYDGSLA